MPPIRFSICGCFAVDLTDNSLNGFSQVVEDLEAKSIEDALIEKIAAEEAHGSCMDDISILTDARQCWRKNAQSSDVVAGLREEDTNVGL